MAAARAWVQGTLVAASTTNPDQDDAIGDAMAWGATAEEVAGLRGWLGGPAGTAVPVWRSNLDIVAAFCLVGSQWRTRLEVAGGRLRIVATGLDYAGVRAGLSGWRIRVTPELWAGLMVMEQAAVAAFNGETA